MIYRTPQEVKRNPLTTTHENNDSFLVSYSGDHLIGKFLYYSIFNKEIIFSFDFFELSHFLLKQKMRLELNNDVIPFFTDKGYVPMDYTIIMQIKKLPNFCSLKISKLTNEITYILNPTSSNDKKRNDIKIVKDAIYQCFDKKRKNVILFSGGFDSTLIAYLAKKKLPSERIELTIGGYKGIKFEPNTLDIEYSKLISNELKLELTVIEADIDLITNEQINELILKQPNTAHFSIIFQEINNHYKNEDVNIISGQQADSILNFGSTSFLKFSGYKIQGLGELVRRLIYLSKPTILKAIFKLLNSNLRNKTHYPQLSLYCGYKKLPYITNERCYSLLSKLYTNFLEKLEDKKRVLESNHIFYIFFHLSGSDASGILNNIHSTGNPLPFNSNLLVNHFCEKNYTLSEKIMPKKPIMDILRQDPKLWSILKARPNTPNLSYEIVFNHISNRLNLEQDFQRLTKKFKLKNLDFCYNNYHLAKCLEYIYEK